MRSDERRHPPLWPVRRALSWGFLRAPAPVNRDTSPVLEASQVHGRMPVWATWEFLYRNKINGIAARATAKKVSRRSYQKLIYKSIELDHRAVFGLCS
jgi:hypothetical protein